MSKMPLPPGYIKLITYADDSTVLASGPNFKPLCDDLNNYLSTLDYWFKERNLFISPSKSTATIFSTFSNDASIQLPIEINGQNVPTVKKPKFLGVTFDNLLSFTEHSDNMKGKVQSKNNVLKALGGTTWGKEKETILNTYKSIGRSTYNYCCQIWSPNLSDTNWTKLQVAQNEALRVATGCVKKTHIDHLHEECSILPVKEHCELITEQFLLATQQPSHPNHHQIPTEPPPRIMRKTLDLKHGNSIRAMLRDEVLEDTRYKVKLKQIHTRVVRETIDKRSENKVLGFAPPKVDDTEKTLPRRTRSILCQLRSGHSSHLNNYLSKIQAETEDKCPKCNQSPHDTQHLFNCPSDPTTLTTLSLWSQPHRAATFLGLDTQPREEQ